MKLLLNFDIGKSSFIDEITLRYIHYLQHINKDRKSLQIFHNLDQNLNSYI